MFNFKQKNNCIPHLLRKAFLIFLFLISGKVYAANLIFMPALGNHYVGDTFKISIVVDSQSVSINSVDSSINFPSEYFDVVSVSKLGSIFSMWIQEPSYSIANQTISFTGGLPTPGFSGSNGKIMDITFRAKKSGVAKINYVSGAVRSNDGLGTDVLQSTGEGEYTISIKPKAPEVPKDIATKPITNLSPEILSLTHPDSDKWYSDRNPKFSWVFPGGFNAIKISYDENPEGTPTIFYSTTTDSREFDNVRDGIYYLHLQTRNIKGWSSISNFKFQIDTERPLNFTLTELDKENATKTQAEFIFDAKDELSGLDYFEIQINDSVPVIVNDTVNQYYKTPVLESGKHVIFIKAYDKAGNFVPSSAMFYTNRAELSDQISFDKILITIKKYTANLLSSTKVYTEKIGDALNSERGSLIAKIITAVGLIGWFVMSVLASAPVRNLYDLWLLLLKLFGLLLAVIGLKKKHSYWGVVYDSITKRPLDLARVLLIDLETGREVTTTITDSYGRYSFLSLHGRYGIETRKTNYASPSIKMKGKTSDEVYDNLYFGGEILITREDEIVTRNIPMDPMIFSWSAFLRTKSHLKVSMIERNIERNIAKMFLVLGDIVAILAVIFAPIPYNIVVVGIYTLICFVSIMSLRKPKPGILIESSTSVPLSFALVKIFKEGTETPFIKEVADRFGNYIARVPAGKYYMTIEKKNDDESYSEVLHTADIDVKNGLINFDIRI